MRRAVSFLPIGLLLLSESLVAASHRLSAIERAREHARVSANNVETLQDAADDLSPPSSVWWSTVGNFMSRYLPGDPSSIDPGFFDDLRIAFDAPRMPSTHLNGLDDSTLLFKRSNTTAQNQKILRMQCRVKPTITHPGWDGEIPNYTPTDSAGRPLPTQTIGDGHGGGGSETIAITTMCGNIHPGATVNTNTSTGPNGQFAWLTCGIDPNSNSTGWNPPFATSDQIITYQGGLRAAVLSDSSPYKSCAKYVELFETAAAEFQVPPLYIAAFALQESGCNPDVDGQGGEQGMMQISPEKCADAPNGNCKDVVYNVRTAVKYFSDVLRSVDNNTFLAVGQYNGWYKGMTYADATTWGVNGDCCRCQRNLSYLMQFFNGWLQNIDAWNPWLGTIHNTNICS